MDRIITNTPGSTKLAGPKLLILLATKCVTNIVNKMSKQSECKEKQGFQKKSPCCGNCVNFTSEMIKEKGFIPGSYWNREKNLRCGIGGFAIGKSNWCKLHEFN